jgi:hypothetical protein
MVEAQDLASLLYRSRFTQIFRAVGLSAAGEAIEFRISGDIYNFIKQPVTSQHAEMAMVIGAAAAFRIGSHRHSPCLDMSGC